jgi:hypothetical protein
MTPDLQYFPNILGFEKMGLFLNLKKKIVVANNLQYFNP